MTEVEARISQLRDAAQRMGTAAANIRAAVEVSHGLVQSLVARGVVSPAADQFFALYRRQRSVMNEWPDDLNDFARLLELAADAIEEAQRGETEIDGGDGEGPVDPGPGEGQGQNQGQGDNQGQSQGQGQGQSQGQNQGQGNSGSGGAFPPIPVPGGTGGAGTGGSGTGTGGGTGGVGIGTGLGTGGSHSQGQGQGQGQGNGNSSTSSESSTEPEAGTAETPGEAQTYYNQANAALGQEVTTKQAEIDSRRANIANLEQEKSSLQGQIDQMLAATGGQPTPRIRGVQQQLADIEALIAGENSSIEQLQQQVDQIQARLALVTPGPGADIGLIQSLEGSRTIDAILNATRQADNSVNCVNWVCTRVPIPPGIPTNALDWVNNAMNHPEYGIQVGNVPLTGSVIVMQPEHSFAHDVYGHVMVVERVDADGSVWVTDNFNHEPVLLSRLTSEVSGPNIQFLYLPWNTQA